MQVNDKILSFRVVSIRENAELGGKLWEFVHEPTGAKVAWMDNGQSNKLFSIGFKTIPTDSTGVFHILEHSVLNGSRKYPVKEPFVNLLKTSMNTFLNAMTFPDKTIFPVSSRNEQDFLNLTSVYLDAVFCPAIYHNPNIFYQEGWHYELTQEDDKPIYNGVVFNEMKGAFSSADGVCMHGLMKLLYSDSCYGHESGGDPVHIPELTYEQFIASHREFYHPGNSYTYLDGAVPLEKVFAMMEEYFSQHTEPAKEHPIAMQAATPYRQETGYYEAAQDGQAMLMMGKRMLTFEDRTALTAMSLLATYLTGSNEAPLKKAILASGIAKEAAMYMEDSIAQPFLGLQVKQLDDSRIQELMELISDFLANHTLDKEDLASTLDQMEFSVRDVREPSGLMRNIMGLNTWLPGGDLLAGMTFNEIFTALRQGLEGDYFEKLLRKIAFTGDDAAMYILLPSATKGEEDRAAEAARLAKASEAWTAEDRKALVALNEKLAAWQAAPDTPEQIATLPVLPLDQINPVPETVETVKTSLGDVPVLLHKTDSKEICHVNAYFSLADLSVEQLQSLSFLTNLLGELPTASHSTTQLEKLKKSILGNLDFNVTAYADLENSQVCKPYFVVSFSCLKLKEAAACQLVAEILTQTLYTAEESQSLSAIILTQGKEQLLQGIIANGNRFGSMRASAHFFAASALQEKMTGCDFLLYLRSLEEPMTVQPESVLTGLAALADKTFRRSRLTLSYACAQEPQSLEGFVEALAGDGERLDQAMVFPTDGANAQEAVIIPAAVSYAAASAAVSVPNVGASDLLANILNYDYLWNEVRVKGGAYGCGVRVGLGGSVGFSSYRDPSPVNSLAVFAGAYDFLKAFSQEGSPLDGYIIGSPTAQDPLMSGRDAARRADSDYFTGICLEDRTLWRKQLLATNRETLLKDNSWLKDISFATCIIGNKDALSQADTASWKIITL